MKTTEELYKKFAGIWTPEELFLMDYENFMKALAEHDNKSSVMKTAFKDVKKYILNQEKQGRIVVMTIEGFAETSLDDIIKQPVDGLLYDLNRSPEVIMTFIKDKKWVNDYACMLVIKKLSQKLAEHDNEIKQLIDEMIGIRRMSLESYITSKAVKKVNAEIMKLIRDCEVEALTEIKNKLGL